MLTKDLLNRLWPQCEKHNPGLIDGIVAAEAAVLQKYGCTDPVVVAQAMAQFSHEFGAGLEPVENLSYTSPQRIAAVWPRHFTAASALPYVRNPRKLANFIYEPPVHNDLGNRPGTDDGFDFRGRGGSQVTGRDGYERLAAKTGLDLLGNPDLVNDPAHWLECAIADFVLCGCLPFAKKDDVRGVTHHLNGGFVGLAEREQWLKRWKAALAASGSAVAAPAPVTDGSLRYGDNNWEVKAAQTRLAELGYMVGKVDGDFGAATRAGVLSFQADQGLPTTGIIDAATRAAMASAPAKPVAEDRAAATADDLRAAGSETVAKADSSNLVAKGLGFVGLLKGADASGILDAAKNATDQFGTLRSIVGTAQEEIEWASSHWWIGAIAAGGLIWYFGRGIIARRLADHRDGLNMGR